MLIAEDSSKKYSATIKEEYNTVCKGPSGKYLFHFTQEKIQKHMKHDEIIAQNIFEFMKKKSSDKTLKAISGNSTNVNTEWLGGAMDWLEIKLERKLNWLVCALYTNELALQHLIATFDGATLSNNKWSRSIGKLLNYTTALEINPSFKRIYFGDPLITLKNKLIKDISTDQFPGYKVVSAIKSGNIPKDLASFEISPANHSRWFTTANRLCRIWVSKHELQGFKKS